MYVHEGSLYNDTDTFESKFELTVR